MPVVSSNYPPRSLGASTVVNSRTTTGSHESVHPRSQAASIGSGDSALMDFGLDYHVKQYGTDALLSGGAIAAGVFMFAPEPIVTKIIGGSIALSCIVAGGVGKHFIYRGAYVHEALEKAVIKLENQVTTLDTEIKILEVTGKGLELTNDKLVRTRDIFQRQVDALHSQVGRLDTNLAQAFEQLNQDRMAFEQEKAAKLGQLSDEIAAADAREGRADFKLDQIRVREQVLTSLADELNGRRETLARSEAELREMQSRLIQLCSGEPAIVNKLSALGTNSALPAEPVMLPAATIQGEDGTSARFPDALAIQNLKVLAELVVSKGAKIRVDSDGHFDIQRAGFLSQSIPRSFQDGASVTSRSHFFRPVFRFFHEAKTSFATEELQQAFNGVCSMRDTYSGNIAKYRIITDLVQVIAVDNPKLEIP